MMTSPLEQELEVARKLAREAGRILLEYYQLPTSVEWKGEDDPVTAADHAANRHLVDALTRLFPGDGILSEESPDDGSRLTHERVWMIDPMDGTKQFIERIPEFSVQIGLTISGAPHLGVVYHPSVDRLFFSTKGRGAFVEEAWTTKRLQVDPEHVPARMVSAMSRSHHSPVVNQILATLGMTRTVASGSVGLKMGMLAEGRAHLYLHPGQMTNLWDTCAPEAILQEAGGTVTDLHGQPLAYLGEGVRNLFGIVASNGAIHPQILAATQQFVQR
jgi:3'(2'), 5'-bisphosphate nucleotidase